MFWKRKAKKKDDAEADAETQGGTGATAAADDENAEAEQAEADRAATEAAEDTDGGDAAAVQRVEMPATLEVDGAEHKVVTSTWIVQIDADGVVVVNPGPDAEAVLDAVGEREIYIVACTNGYRPHIEGAVAVAERDEAPIALHPRELRRWRKVHGVEHNPEIEAEGGGRLSIGDFELEILATPGTAPGSLSYHFPELGVVCSGDTLLAGRLGTVGEGYMDYTTQLASVGETLLSLPAETRVLPSTGEETTVGAESENFDSWVAGD